MCDVHEPLVFHGYLKQVESASNCKHSWECMWWDAKTWGKLFGEKLLHFRIGSRVTEGDVLSSPQWETTCLKGSMSYDEFLQWSDGQRNCRTSCGQEVDSSTHWAYFDYFYMKELEHLEDMKGVIDWGRFGFHGRGVQDSTLWIGTIGANTPCHIDTYGCNLVVQVLGKKRWVLFPMSQSQYLSPTRIPYEESSIYSQVGFPRPCLMSHPELCSSTPYVVTLEPGDVLYVPNQWWHFVENLEFSVSINTWLELPSDNTNRVKEALVMYQVGSLCQGIESIDYLNSIFNPNMMNVATMTSSDLLQLLASKVFQKAESKSKTVGPCSSSSNLDSTECSNISGKKKILQRSKCATLESGAGSSTEVSHHLYTLNWNNLAWCAEHGIEKVRKLSFNTYMASVLGSDIKTEYEKSLSFLKSGKALKIRQDQSHDDSDETSISLQHLKLLIDSLSDYRVIDLIKKVIDEKLQKDGHGYSNR